MAVGTHAGPSHTPSPMSQNQTVKCTLLLSINREATLKKKKKKYSGERMLEPGRKKNNNNNKESEEELKKKERGPGREGSGSKSCI